MLSPRQKKIEEYIDSNCEDFPFPEGVKTLFDKEELEEIAKQAEICRDFLRAVNKVKLQESERISEDQVKKYYYNLMVYSVGELIVDRLTDKVNGEKHTTRETEAMENYLERIKKEVASKEVKETPKTLDGILKKSSKR